MPVLTNQQKTGQLIDAVSQECMEHISPFQMGCVAIGEGTKPMDQVAPVHLLHSAVEAQVWHAIYTFVVFEKEDLGLYRNSLLMYGRHLLKVICEHACRSVVVEASADPADTAIALYRFKTWTNAITVVGGLFNELVESFR